MSFVPSNPGIPNIFDAGNCSLISQLLPADTKKFLSDFMQGNAFRNPVGQVVGLLKDKVGLNLDKISGLDAFNDDLSGLNSALLRANRELGDFLAHTNRISGVTKGQGLLPSLDRIVGVMSAYNSVKDLLKNPGDLLEDNFSNAFSSLNPQIVGPFFENFGQNMLQISSLLDTLGGQVGGDAGETLRQLAQLTRNINAISDNINNLINGDIDAFALALAFVERYALGNNIISTALTDPCFGAQLMKNLILTDDFSGSLGAIAEQNSIEIEGGPVNFLDFTPSLQG